MSDVTYVQFVNPGEEPPTLTITYKHLPNGHWLMTVRSGESLIVAETLPFICMLTE